MLNNKHENKCNKCGRSHDIGNAQPRVKHVVYVKEQGTMQSLAIKNIGDNPITSHLVFQEQIKCEPSNPTIN